MRIVLSILSLVLVLTAMTARGSVADFSNLSLAPGSYVNNASFSSDGISFVNNYTATYDSWDGFSYSNVSDSTTPGYGNQYAAYSGQGANGTGSIYAVGYYDPIIDLPTGQRPVSVDLTNTTYTALSMKNGDSFAKKFGGSTGNDPDYFNVTLTGYTGPDGTGSATGALTFYLADYRFANNSQDYIVNQWTPVDLSTLGDAESIAMSFDSSDVGSFGINTPTYVAVDDLTTTAVPEPTGMAVLVIGGFLATRRRAARCH